MRKLSAKLVPKCLNADQKRQRCQSSEQLLIFFFSAIQMISCRDYWLWTKPGYITMTQRQSNNQYSGGIAAHLAPKNSECKNPLEKFSSRFFGIKTASSSLIIFQRSNLSTRSISHLCRCNWRTFEGKTPREGHQGGLVLARQCPGSPGTCNPEETGLQELAPSDYHLFAGLIKQLKGRHFSSDAEIIVAAKTWFDGQHSEFFFEWLAQVRATG